MASHHLFFALWPDDALRERIGATATRLAETRAPRGRWTDARRYHLTVVFLGRTSTTETSLAEAALAAGDAVRVAPFDFALDVAGSFSNRSIPWWLGSRAGIPGLDALRTALLAQLRAANVTVREDPVHVAHVTILRDADRPLESTPIAPIAWHVPSFALIASTLGGSAGYEVLQSWPLRA